MFIRRTQTRNRASGEPYTTYRLVQTARVGAAVKQTTLLNLGSHFDLPADEWGALAQHIDELMHGQRPLLDATLSEAGQALAQRYAAQLIALQPSAASLTPATAAKTDPGEVGRYQEVDLDSLDLVRPRSVGVEHAAQSVMRQCGLEDKLAELGLNRPQIAAAVGNMVGRMAHPGSELATHAWLCQRSALGELLSFDFEAMDLNRLYRASDALYKHREALQDHLFAQARSIFGFGETITLYDLTNTYFEGVAAGVAKAKRGHSKECRGDCPLVTLAMALDGSGFPRRSRVFAGNAAEPATLKDMLTGLNAPPGATVVMDAGIATEANLTWLRAQGYHYVVVSRLRERQFDPALATEVQSAGKVTIKIQRVIDAQGHALLYCHSPAREQKDRAIDAAKAAGFEAVLLKLQAGLSQPRGTRDLAKIMERLGRAKQRYARAAQHYQLEVTPDDTGTQVRAIPLDPTREARHRGRAPGRVLPAHDPRGLGQRHAVAHLHDADRAGVGVPFAEDRSGLASGVPPDRPARRRASVHQRAGLPLRAHAAPATQGPRYRRQLGDPARGARHAAPRDGHVAAPRWPNRARAQGHSARAESSKAQRHLASFAQSRRNASGARLARVHRSPQTASPHYTNVVPYAPQCRSKLLIPLGVVVLNDKLGLRCRRRTPSRP